MRIVAGRCYLPIFALNQASDSFASAANRERSSPSALKQHTKSRQSHTASATQSFPGSGNCRDAITLFIGTRDIFLPDCRQLRNKAIAENVNLNYREYDGMVHDWMLGPLPESKQVLREIVNQLNG